MATPVASPLPTPAQLNSFLTADWTAMLHMEFTAVEASHLTAIMTITPGLIAPNSFVHAGALITFADTVCGFGCRAYLPAGASGFTTVELKSNFLGAAREGLLTCEGHLVHGGRSTQVWDATITSQAKGQTIALFRCTQMIIYPR